MLYTKLGGFETWGWGCSHCCRPQAELLSWQSRTAPPDDSARHRINIGEFEQRGSPATQSRQPFGVSDALDSIRQITGRPVEYNQPLDRRQSPTKSPAKRPQSLRESASAAQAAPWDPVMQERIDKLAEAFLPSPLAPRHLHFTPLGP